MLKKIIFFMLVLCLASASFAGYNNRYTWTAGGNGTHWTDPNNWVGKRFEDVNDPPDPNYYDVCDLYDYPDDWTHDKVWITMQADLIIEGVAPQECWYIESGLAAGDRFIGVASNSANPTTLDIREGAHFRMRQGQYNNTWWSL